MTPAAGHFPQVYRTVPNIYRITLASAQLRKSPTVTPSVSDLKHAGPLPTANVGVSGSVFVGNGNVGAFSVNDKPLGDTDRTAGSEARAWRLLQAMPDPVVVADADGIIELVNIQAVALFGYQPDELIGQPVERLIPVGLHDAHRAHRTAYVAAEHATPMSTGPNIVAVCKDGTTVPVEVNLSAITLATGRAVLASIRDVSDRKLADAELRISDERFRVSFDSAPIGMALLDLRREAAGRFLRVNAAFCELTGYCEADVLATDSAAITHPGDRDETVTNLSQLVNGTATRWDTDKRYRNASGVDVWVHSAVSVVHDAGGTPSYGVMQVEDITDRKRAEAQVEERFRELATNVGVGFVLRQIDPPEYLYFNPAYLTVFGFDPAGPPPTPAESLAQIHPEDMERVAAILGGAAQGERIEQEWRFIRPDGEVRWVSGRVSPITDQDALFVESRACSRTSRRASTWWLRCARVSFGSCNSLMPSRSASRCATSAPRA